jgi:hypothetical protein
MSDNLAFASGFQPGHWVDVSCVLGLHYSSAAVVLPPVCMLKRPSFLCGSFLRKLTATTHRIVCLTAVAFVVGTSLYTAWVVSDVRGCPTAQVA